MKKVLITGANSYIGESVRSYLLREPDNYSVDVIDTFGLDPTPECFESYDVVFNVAGIAHTKETKKNRQLYYEVNRDLVVSIAKAAKEAGVKQFILLSSMSVYGVTTGHITKNSIVNPRNAYGDSKAQADRMIAELKNESFKFACLRPPMVYGRGCKGNYQNLRTFALKTPVFPDYCNERSMIYIENLAEFVKKCIDEENSGVFFPQNAEYVNTTEMVCLIANIHKKKIHLTKVLNWLVRITPFTKVKKVFGNLTYERTDVINKYGFPDSVYLTESEG